MQKTKMGAYYNYWKEVFRGMSQVSILGPLLFNIFINYIFPFVEKSGISQANFAISLYSWGKHQLRIKQDFIYDIKILLKRFKINSLKSDPGEFQFLVQSVVNTH